MTNAENSGPHGREPGILSRITNAIYWMVMVEAMLVIAALPGLVGIFFLARTASNIPLYALCAIPLAPAFSAAMFALRRRAIDDDLAPVKQFWRGWRLNTLDVLKLWVPLLTVLTVLAIDIAHGGDAGVPAPFVWVSVVLCVVALMWWSHALVLTSLFAFRTRDVARLGAYYAMHRPLVTLGGLSLFILAVGVVWIGSDWVLALLGAMFALLVLRNAAPVVQDAAAEFVRVPDPQ